MRIGVNPWLRWLFTFDLRYLRNPRLNGCSAVFSPCSANDSKRQQMTANDSKQCANYSKLQQMITKLQQTTANDCKMTAQKPQNRVFNPIKQKSPKNITQNMKKALSSNIPLMLPEMLFLNISQDGKEIIMVN